MGIKKKIYCSGLKMNSKPKEEDLDPGFAVSMEHAEKILFEKENV